MGDLWKRMKRGWDGEGGDDLQKQLRLADRRFFLYSNLMTCMSTAILVLLAIPISDRWILRENGADMEKAIDIVRAYMVSATEDEYDRITQTIRHDLVLNGHDKDMLEYAHYIPNSSEGCCVCKKDYLNSAGRPHLSEHRRSLSIGYKRWARSRYRPG